MQYANLEEYYIFLRLYEVFANLSFTRIQQVKFLKESVLAPIAVNNNSCGKSDELD